MAPVSSPVANTCGACHSAPAGRPFAGGLAIHSPVGSIISSNITPSRKFGIGGYSEQQFARALRMGVRADGANLYPAMPYTSYARLTDDDVHALYAYFEQGVAPVDQSAPDTQLPFPFDIRLSMKVWNLLFLDGDVYQPDPSRSDAWNRGKYLVTGAAHCGECHTPRGFLMEQERSRDLGGGPVDAWKAPNITPDPLSGIGSWANAEIVQYLRTGKVDHKAQAASSMAEAVQDSFQYLTDADLSAIAVYLKTVPVVHDARDKASRFGFGRAFTSVATLRGSRAIAAESGQVDGALLFQANCTTCHSVAAQGSRDNYYPSLFDNSVTGAGDASNLIAAVLYGVHRTVGGTQAFMPGFGGKPNDLGALTDAQIALLGNYVEQHFGNPEVVVTEADVARSRHGGPTSALLPVARLGMGIAGLLALMFFGWAARRALRPRPHKVSR
jgi:mono/diheme cytochrome c family protein